MTVRRLMILVGGLLGFSGVILAAAGSHMIPGLDDAVAFKSWQSANSMHLLHAISLIALAALYRQQGGQLILLAAVLITAGVTLFSGSIYLSLMTDLEGATRFAPVGGTLLILGWLMIAVSAFGSSEQ